MKILHGPLNIGGMAGVLARAQRQLGVEAFSYCLSNSFQYNADRLIEAVGTSSRIRELGAFFFRHGLSYDGFQYYFDSSFTGKKFKELAFLKSIGKKLYFYFCGCDIRDSKINIEKHRFSACRECWPMLCSPNREKALRASRRYADAIFVSTPDLLESVPEAVLLPQPIDMERFQQVRGEAEHITASQDPRQNKLIRIAHAPTNRVIKGSGYLIQAVESMRKRGMPVELVLVEGKPYAEAMRQYATADIVVDQLLIGSYGQVSVEIMALSKPVVCYIREDLREHYPRDLPVISANVENIEAVLERLVEQRDQWVEIGQKGLDFVRRHHDSLVVARRALDYYK